MTVNCFKSLNFERNLNQANLIMKKIIVNETPHLCLLAAKDIQIGEELRFV